MKKYLLALLLLPAICFAQVKTEVNTGLDPITGETGYLNYDTSRTLYFQGPALVVNGDTVFFAGSSGVWALNGTKAYYLGYAGLGTTFPRSRFEVQTNYNTTVAIDSLGILLSQTNPATITTFPTAGPLIFEPPGFNTTTSSSQKSRFRIYAQGAPAVGGGYPNVFFQVAKDTSTYVTAMAFTGYNTSFFGTVNGPTGVWNSLIMQGVNGTFQQTAAGINNYFNATTSGLQGQSYFGKSPYVYPSEPSSIVQFYSGGSQGILMPVMTQSQIDSMGFTISSISVTPGTGYTTAPTVSANGYLNGSAISPNGLQSWGGNYLTTTSTISGGGLVSVTVVHGGYYNGAVRLLVGGGGGTGATATVTGMTRILPEGLIVYNSTIHAFQTWTGSKFSTGSYISKTATLASGTVTVSEPSCLSTSRIMVSCNTPSGTQGFLSVPQSTVSAGSFVINSSSALDNSTVNWIVTN